MYTKIIILLLSTISILLAYPSDLVFPESQGYLDLIRRPDNQLHTQSNENTTSVIKNILKSPSTTATSQNVLAQTTEKYLYVKNITQAPLNATRKMLETTKSEHEAEEDCSESESDDKKSTIDSRFVFDSPCKSGYRRDNNNNCRKVYKLNANSDVQYQEVD